MAAFSFRDGMEVDEELLRILKKNYVKIITSSDAHGPEDVGYKIKELNSLIVSAWK